MRISDWISDVCSSDLREVAGLNIPRRNVEPGERGGDLVHGFRVAGAGGLRVGGDARQAGSEQRLIGGGFGAPRAGDGQHGFVAIDTARVGRSGGAGGEAEQGREEQGWFHGNPPGSFLVSIVARWSAQIQAATVWQCPPSSTSQAASRGGVLRW